MQSQAKKKKEKKNDSLRGGVVGLLPWGLITLTPAFRFWRVSHMNHLATVCKESVVGVTLAGLCHPCGSIMVFNYWWKPSTWKQMLLHVLRVHRTVSASAGRLLYKDKQRAASWGQVQGPDQRFSSCSSRFRQGSIVRLTFETMADVSSHNPRVQRVQVIDVTAEIRWIWIELIWWLSEWTTTLSRDLHFGHGRDTKTAVIPPLHIDRPCKLQTLLQKWIALFTCFSHSKSILCTVVICTSLYLNLPCLGFFYTLFCCCHTCTPPVHSHVSLNFFSFVFWSVALEMVDVNSKTWENFAKKILYLLKLVFRFSKKIAKSTKGEMEA